MHYLRTATQTIFTAGGFQLKVLGTIQLTIDFFNGSVSCVFVVIADVLNYAILGFDFLISQRLLLHPSYGVVQVDFQIPQFKTNYIYPPKHEGDVNHFSTPVLTHTCIPVTSKHKYDIPLVHHYPF